MLFEVRRREQIEGQLQEPRLEYLNAIFRLNGLADLEFPLTF